MPIIVKTETRRAQLRHIARWSAATHGSGKGVAVAVALLYIALAAVVAGIALGGVAVATVIGTDPLWLSVPIGVGAPVIAGLTWTRLLPTLDLILGVTAGVRISPPYWKT